MMKIEKVETIEMNPNQTLSAEVTAENLENSATSTDLNENLGNLPNNNSGDSNKISKKQNVRDWWKKHKPSKRRLIQIYAALLYNANIKGFITGEIFTGMTKVACVPGMNCYSCPGAVGACPLGSLQNALANKNYRMPYYVFGIILLYCIIFGRTICGFLCPVGLGQDLLFKIKTPKLKKSKFTRILSYLKYVMLAVLVFGVTLVFTGLDVVVPAFCKYICPAGTFGGAIMLLLNPANENMYSMLGPLFTWKMIVLIVVMVASIFVYRAFCRFLCPLGAIYGIFNRFAMLGIKVNQDDCTNCGKCVNVCKMDVKKVGDHECINCGECISSCPTSAITWKGGKIFLKSNEVNQEVKGDNKVGEVYENNETNQNSRVFDETAFDDPTAETKEVKREKTKKVKSKMPKDKRFWLKVVAITLAVALLVGVFTYVNFFAGEKKDNSSTYEIVVSNIDGENGSLQFTIGDSSDLVLPQSGSGTKNDPFILKNIEGSYWITIDDTTKEVYFSYTTDKKGKYKVSTSNEKLGLYIYFVLSGKEYGLYDFSLDGNEFELTLNPPDGMGNSVGFTCFDFTLKNNITGEDVSLSDFKGKVVIVNFWATWCGPCVVELPHFEDVRKNHENVEVIAIHSANVDEPVKDYIEGKWRDWGIVWLQDRGTAQLSEIYDLLGGRNAAYPRTLIVDESGVIRYVFEGSITKSALEAAVKSIQE